MKQKIYTSGLFLFFLVMLSTCILTGCSDDKKSNHTEKKGKKSHSASVDMSSWPDDLPKFKDGKLFQVFNNKDTGVLSAAIFGNIKNIESAYKNYKAALIKNGWVVDYERTDEHLWAGGYTKEPKSVNVNILKDDSGSVAQIMYLDK